MRGRSVLMWSVADILVRCPFPGRVGRVVFGCSEFAVTTDVCVCVARILCDCSLQSLYRPYMKYITERSDANLPEPVSCPPEFPSISDKKEEGTATECRGGDAIPIERFSSRQRTPLISAFRAANQAQGHGVPYRQFRTGRSESGLAALLKC